MKTALAAILVFIFSIQTFAAEAIEGRYGPEFTFTYDGAIPPDVRWKFIMLLREHLVENQPEGAKFKEEGIDELRYFRSPNGWWFAISTDPGVLEISMSPLTVEEIRRFKGDIQDAIFVSAANSGLFPWDYLGGGHINVDTRIFGGNLLLARNFIVDFWNHSELSMGILNYDTKNAMPFALYTKEAQAQILQVIQQADDGWYGDNDVGIARFFSELKQVLYAGNTVFNEQKYKNHDLHFGNAGRIEIRSARPQANMDVWLSQVELIENRINKHLRRLRKPIPLKLKTPPLKKNLADLAEHPSLVRYNPPVNPQLALKNFHRYVRESGLDWKNHRVYIWPPWFREGELQIFEAKRSFCADLLKR